MPAHTEQEARERLRLHHYHLWKGLMEVEEDPGLLEEARHAPRGSKEWRNAFFYEQALRMLEVSMSD
jgi:hypothetical protein